MQLSIAAVTPSSFSRSRGSSVGQRAVTGLIFQNLDFSLKIHKKAEVKREMDSVPQQRSQAACNHGGWYICTQPPSNIRTIPRMPYAHAHNYTLIDSFFQLVPYSLHWVSTLIKARFQAVISVLFCCCFLLESSEFLKSCIIQYSHARCIRPIFEKNI